MGINCLGYVLAAHLIIPFYTVANYELAVINKTKFIATSTVLSAMVNIGLNFLFIPKMGIVGGAISTFCTYLFLALITNLWSRIKAGWDIVYLRFIFLMFLFVNGLLLIMAYFNNRMPVQVLVFAIGIIILSILLFSLFKKLKAVFAIQPIKGVVA
nr:polysaccharide biosynthesis C-terminal domain-containing protein [Mucilaginibacter aquariorum]